ncbi:MAG: hypothetical protein A2512_10260 [Deltaproteobacteria bacterium RIFOXYD12_FULL_56_24]|nr:MAG: hypothetical protein A2512_10260 [Deltaproteobacteria bacterium RIFOXYD12_FULL_56_24]
MGNRALVLVGLLLLLLGVGACGQKSSTVEGKLVDWNGNPVAKVKIVAALIKPIEGTEPCEAVTGPDGTFRIKGLRPASAYLLKPKSESWTTHARLRVDSAAKGKTLVLPGLMQIDHAYAIKGGGLLVDLVSGKTSFTASPDGVISDFRTGLEWLVGPDQDTNYQQAEEWFSNNSLAGGGWRMPTKSELKALYAKGAGERNMDPAFKTTGKWVWAEPRDAMTAWTFNFEFGLEKWGFRNDGKYYRVFGVRSQSR